MESNALAATSEQIDHLPEMLKAFAKYMVFKGELKVVESSRQTKAKTINRTLTQKDIPYEY